MPLLILCEHVKRLHIECATVMQSPVKYMLLKKYTDR